ncbi:hypothetical protein [Haloferula sp. BvORR071]|uniref:hypothetical protein n=1 Tax=Haloferula sp. BvORR071 TaxID=1396141 RepID=UPI002240FC3E|nr:hypothetical protein [Haloferula sp. BvORR071]
MLFVKGSLLAACIVVFLLGDGRLGELWVWFAVALVLVSLATEGIFQVLKLRELRAMGWVGSEPGMVTYGLREPERSKRGELYYAEERQEWKVRIIARCIALPALVYAVWVWTEPVLGWSNRTSPEQVMLMVIGAVVLAGIDRIFADYPRKAAFLRNSPVAAFLVLIMGGIYERHPYLLPNNPEAKRDKAERLIAWGDSVATQRHVAALADYGNQLEAEGKIREAGEMLQMAARVDNTDAGLQDAYADFLEQHGKPEEEAIYRKLAADLRSGAALQVSNAPYQLDDAPALPLLTANTPPGHAIVMVADALVPRKELDALGAVLRKELVVPVYLHPQVIHQGSVGSRRSEPNREKLYAQEQWKVALSCMIEPPWQASRQYLVVVGFQTFQQGREFVCGVTVAPAAAVVHYQRLAGDQIPGSDARLWDELCKTSIAAAIRTFTIYPCPDTRDVTAQVYWRRDLEKLGRRPLPATLGAYRREVARWQAKELPRAREKSAR